MYQMNDIDLWRQHHEDLLREAEEGRLVRRLKAAHAKRAARRWNALLGRAPVLVEAGGGDLNTGDGRCA